MLEDMKNLFERLVVATEGIHEVLKAESEAYGKLGKAAEEEPKTKKKAAKPKKKAAKKEEPVVEAEPEAEAEEVAEEEPKPKKKAAKPKKKSAKKEEPVEEPEEEAETEPSFPYDTLKASVGRLVAHGPEGVASVKEIFKEFGVKRAYEIPEDQWEEANEAVLKAVDVIQNGGEDEELA